VTPPSRSTIPSSRPDGLPVTSLDARSARVIEPAPGPAPTVVPVRWGRRVVGVLAAIGMVMTVVVGASAVGAPPGIAVVVGLLLVPIAHDWVARPMFRRLALRNGVRRKGEAVLVVAGSLLGTAIITASFVVGDTITTSLRDTARTRLGPIDEVIEVLEVGDLDALERAVTEPEAPPGVDGTLRAVAAAGAAANDDPDRPRAAPAVALLEVDFDAARAFGGDPGATGLATAGATPTGDEAVINERLAAELEVGVGDPIRVYAYGYGLDLVVRSVVDEIGLAGYVPVEGAGFGPSDASPVFVEPGTVERLAALSTVPTARPPAGQLLVSNEGGVFDSHERAGEIADDLERRVAEIEAAEVQTVKTDTLERAEENGASIEELYRGIGMFSVIAGVLLLVNLFVMLADERKVELGMLRALGFRRNHLCRTFGIEGSAYATVAAAAGAVLGIGVGWIITGIASRIVASDGGGVPWRLHVDPASLVVGALVGLAISLLTIWATSVRLARLNVIAAIRDLPEPRRTRPRPTSLVLGAAGVVVGLLLFAEGSSADEAMPVMAGVPIAAFCLIPLLSRLLPRKPVIVGSSLLVIGWTVAVFSLFPDAMTTSEIPVFVLMGVLLVSAAVALSAQVDRFWVSLNARLHGIGGGLSARLGLAYPLARKFRTGMLLGMYAIVIFTMTFMSSFIGMFAAQAPSFTADIAAGYDVFVTSNPGNPVTTTQLLEQPGVEGVAPLLYGFPQWSAQGEEGGFPLTGFDESLLDGGAIGLSSRADRFGSDEAVFRAVLEDDTLVVVDDFFLQRGGGPPEQLVGVGDTVTVTDPATGASRDLEVVGVLSSDFVFHGVLAGRPFVEDLLGPQAAEIHHYVRLSQGSDAEEVADTLTGRFVANGADAAAFRQLVDRQLEQNVSFFGLMRGYLGLGLLIGIAGLGVVMVRAVRERRREIGMLRAMGFGRGVVRRAFLVEAAFIAVQGSIIGISLGLLTSYEVVVNSSTFGDEPLPFEVPWFTLMLILVLPLLASLAAAAVPATQAARIEPAVALRIAD